MNDKKADNKEHKLKSDIIFIDDNIDINKRKLDNLDENIQKERNKLKSIDNLEETFGSIHSKLMKCAVLLGESMKSEKTNSIISEMEESNQVIYHKTLSSLDDERINTNNEIKELNDKKEEINRELKNMYEEKDKKYNHKEEKVGSEGEDAHNSN
ncbi:MAG: hypothetical protein ACI33S_02090 [Bacilli bacterium]